MAKKATKTKPQDDQPLQQGDILSEFRPDDLIESATGRCDQVKSITPETRVGKGDQVEILPPETRVGKDGKADDGSHYSPTELSDRTEQPLPDDGRQAGQRPRKIYRPIANESLRAEAAKMAEGYRWLYDWIDFYGGQKPSVNEVAQMPLVIVERLGSMIGGGTDYNIKNNLINEALRIWQAKRMIESGISKAKVDKAAADVTAAQQALKAHEASEPMSLDGESIVAAETRLRAEARRLRDRLDDAQRRHANAQRDYSTLCDKAPKLLREISRSRQNAVKSDRFHSEADLKAAAQVIHDWAKVGVPTAEMFLV